MPLLKLSFLEKHLAKFGFAAFVSPFLVADKAKSGVFPLCSDVDQTCDLLRFKVFLENACCEPSVAVSPTPLRLLVRELRVRVCVWGGFCPLLPPTPSWVRSAECHGGAQVKWH